MKNTLAVHIIAKNAESSIKKTLESIHALADEILVVDNNSTDKTVAIAKEYNARIFSFSQTHEGLQRKIALDNSRSTWVFVLDTDEVVPQELLEEIRKTVSSKNALNAYFVLLQSFYLNKPLHYGGENNKKLLLFKKNAVTLQADPIHAHFVLATQRVGILKNHLNHYSYPSLWSIYKKFTGYADRMAAVKAENGESSNIKKLLFYPVHMFYSRFVLDKGYKDGLLRIPLDTGFAYMEFLTYFLLLFKQIKKYEK